MFGPPEYFGLMTLSMALIAGISGKSMLKGLIAGMIGLLVSVIGLDPIYGSQRLTFKLLGLADGVDTLSVFIGAFAVSELLVQLGTGRSLLNQKAKAMGKMQESLSLKEYLSQTVTMVQSGIIGALIGILPGIGGSTASFMSYASAQKRSKHPEKFGTGIIDGVAAAESANNAVCGGALVPMLTLGIPGDVVTAILVGALIAQGIKPGPMLFVENMFDVYTIYIALLFAVLALAVVGTLGIPVFSKIVSVRKSILLPMVFLICFVGTYASRSDYFSCYVMLIFGVIGYFLRKFKYSLSPMIIAFVIGGQLESNFRRSLLLDPALGWQIFFTRPLAVSLIIISVVATIFMIRSNMKSNATT
jgi:putative tricarboxylic transport membrane protein